MNNTHYISLKVIMDRLLRNTNLENLQYESVIDYTVDFLQIMGIANLYEEKIYTTIVDQYRAAIPCDFISEGLVSLRESSNKEWHPARYTTDAIKDYKCADIKVKSDYTYSINNSYIFTSIEKGEVKLVYKAIMTDEEGYPMLPSDSNFLDALEWYIKKQYYTILWESGSIEDKRLSHTEQEYCWAVGRLETARARLSLGEMESLMNSFRQLVPRDNEFANRFKSNGRKEFYKNHR